MRKATWAFLWAVAAYLLLCAAVALFLAQSTLHPFRRELTSSEETEMRHDTLRLRSQIQDVEITTADSVVLRAWYIRPIGANSDAVMLLHGLGDNRLGTVGYAEILLRHGYSVLMPDARAHGNSAGKFATYGILEREDVKQWFDWLADKTHPNCIFGLGESMGAAQLLQSLAVEPNFCAVIAESSFSSFREIAYDRMGQQFNTGRWLGHTLLRPVVEIALAYVRLRYDIDLTRASPEEAVASTRVPVLLIHGAQDENIPPYHSRSIRLRNATVKLWEVPGAGHCGAIAVARSEFEQRMVSWFEENGRVSSQVSAFEAH